MSRIGNLPIEVPQGVKITVTDNRMVVEGPKGKLEQDFQEGISINLEGNVATVARANETKKVRAFHGLYRKLLQNMVIGVSQGFQKVLLINGVGYRAEVKGNTLHMNLGFSNPIEYMIEDGITITCDGPNKVIVGGIDKQRVGQVSAEIRSLRAPEPYKGKGIKYEDEHVRRKVGKSGVK
jgi:large subunit ribosomal protein L6